MAFAWSTGPESMRASSAARARAARASRHGAWRPRRWSPRRSRPRRAREHSARPRRRASSFSTTCRASARPARRRREDAWAFCWSSQNPGARVACVSSSSMSFELRDVKDRASATKGTPVGQTSSLAASTASGTCSRASAGGVEVGHAARRGQDDGHQAGVGAVRAGHALGLAEVAATAGDAPREARELGALGGVERGEAVGVVVLAEERQASPHAEDARG